MRWHSSTASRVPHRVSKVFLEECGEQCWLCFCGRGKQMSRLVNYGFYAEPFKKQWEPSSAKPVQLASLLEFRIVLSHRMTAMRTRPCVSSPLRLRLRTHLRRTSFVDSQALSKRALLRWHRPQVSGWNFSTGEWNLGGKSVSALVRNAEDAVLSRRRLAGGGLFFIFLIDA